MGETGKRGFGWLGAALVLGLLALALVWARAFDPHAAMAWLVARRAQADAHPVMAAAAYFGAYVAFAALSLPGAWAVSVAGGALFGPWLGPPMVSISSTAGATLAMLAARYVFRDAVAARFPDLAARVDRADGVRWLFAARLTPVIPFFAVNLAVGLTRMRAATFALVTMIGAAPFALLYALAGARLATIASPSDVLSPGLLAIFAAVGFAPLLAGAVGRWRARWAVRGGGARTASPD